MPKLKTFNIVLVSDAYKLLKIGFCLSSTFNVTRWDNVPLCHLIRVSFKPIAFNRQNLDRILTLHFSLNLDAKSLNGKANVTVISTIIFFKP